MEGIKLIKNSAFPISLIILSIYLFLFVIMSNGMKVLIHDNLDSNVVLYKILAESGKIFSSNDELIPNIMNGVPRSCLTSGLNLQVLLYYIFPAPAAYSINMILIHLIAFIGTYLLMKKHILTSDKNELLSSGVALSYGFLPFFPPMGISVAGLPLVLYAFLNLYKSDSGIHDWVIIFLFPFYSFLHFSGLFFILLLLILPLHYLLKHKKINWMLAAGLALLSVTYAIVEYRLIMSLLGEGFQHHRMEMVQETTLNINGLIGTSLQHFIFGQYHSESMHFPVIMLCAALGLVFSKERRIKKLIISLALLSFMISLSYKLLDWHGMERIYRQISFLNYAQIRFYVLFPLLWYLIFGISVTGLTKIKNQFLLYGIIVMQIIYSLAGSSDNTYRTIFFPITHTVGFASFDEYYQPKFFYDIKKELNEDLKSFNVVGLGINPAILQYNGFQTLDGYLNIYPLEYKNKFRKIIAGELNKNDAIRDNFDKWGNRFYLFIGGKIDKGNVNELSVNTGLLKELNCRYIFSRYTIGNAEELDLSLCYEFNNPLNPIISHIYVYRLGTDC